MVDPEQLLALLSTRRSVRKFHEERQVSRDILERIVKAAQYTPFSCNAQAIDYLVATSDEARDTVFSHVTFAHHVEGMQPDEGERPSAYIAALLDTSVILPLCAAFEERFDSAYALRAHDSFLVSYGMVLQAMVTQAMSEAVSTCPIAGVDEEGLKRAFEIDEKYSIPALLALGYAREEHIPLTVTGEHQGSFRYFSQGGRLVVPKREPHIQWR